jgi:hypothetical protein
VIVCIAAIITLVLAFILIRRLRLQHKDPKYIPTAFLKKRWKNWDPKPPGYRLPDQGGHLEPISSRGGRPSEAPLAFDVTAGNAETSNGGRTAGGVDRNTSVRSVMTLPAYHQNPLQNEQVLGREGERGGIDVVLEFPETVDEEEQHREEEMEALYQVRLARRRENEEREERRRLRREARERGDYAALREIAARARAGNAAAAGQTVEELRAEHDRLKKERQRAVSSVAYGDLGVARHDGTRLRANSQDSERTGLLGDAASIAASSHYHRRDRSASSILSIDTMGSDMPSPRLTRSRANSRPDSPPGSRSGPISDRAGSSPEMIEHEDIPPNSPPGYENISLDTPSVEHSVPIEPPPDYSSPVFARGEQPSIESQIPLSATSTESAGEQSQTRGESSGGRRASSSTHMGALEIESSSRASSSSTLSTSRPPTERRGSRGVGGVPQLPSLRLASLPSIQVDPGSPRVGRITEESHQGRSELE